MQTIKPEKIITTISNLKTGEIYKTEDEWKAKGVPEAEIRRDVKVFMPSLDLFPKTKQCGKMAIIRSKIARQLLAEGGAPRKPFANGGFDYESAAAFGSDVDDFGMDFVDSDESAGGGNVNFTPQGPSIRDRIGTGIDNTRDALTRRGINRNMMSTRDAILSLNPF